MTCLARTLKLQIPPLLSCVTLDNVDDGKVAHHLEVFRNMPRIDNGLPSWLVLLEKGVVITLILPEVLDQAIALAGSLRVDLVHQPVGRDHNLRYIFLAELPHVLFFFPARGNILLLRWNF